MKTARISLAIASGALLSLGWAAAGSHDTLHPARILAGFLFGSGLAVSMITGSARITRKTLWFLVAPLLLGLVIFQALNSAPTKAIVTACVGVAYLGIQVAFSSLPADPSNKPAADKDAPPPES